LLRVFGVDEHQFGGGPNELFAPGAVEDILVELEPGEIDEGALLINGKVKGGTWSSCKRLRISFCWLFSVMESFLSMILGTLWGWRMSRPMLSRSCTKGQNCCLPSWLSEVKNKQSPWSKEFIWMWSWRRLRLWSCNWNFIN